jgi:AraC-like DNA-binding protein
MKRGLWVFRHHMAGPMGTPHVHDQIEVLVVEKGWILHRQCGHDLRVEVGSLIAFWSAFPHHTLEMAPDTDLLLFYLPLDFFGTHAAANLLIGHWLARNTLHDTDGASNLAWARDCLERSADPTPIAQRLLHLRIEMHLLEIARRQQLGSGAVTTDGNAGQAAVTDIIRTVLAHYHEPLNVTALATTAGLHPDYAVRLFKRTVGLGLWEFVLQVRVAHAQNLLMDPGVTVLDAGLAAGFGSASRFHEVFRRITGLTPDVYRRQAQDARNTPNSQGLKSVITERQGQKRQKP